MVTQKKRFTIFVDGQARYSTWARGAGTWNGGRYMTNGQVFSVVTGKQKPYKMHVGVVAEQVS